MAVGTRHEHSESTCCVRRRCAEINSTKHHREPDVRHSTRLCGRRSDFLRVPARFQNSHRGCRFARKLSALRQVYSQRTPNIPFRPEMLPPLFKSARNSRCVRNSPPVTPIFVSVDAGSHRLSVSRCLIKVGRDGLPRAGSRAAALNNAPPAAARDKCAYYPGCHVRISRSWPKICSCMAATRAVDGPPCASSRWAAIVSYRLRPLPVLLLDCQSEVSGMLQIGHVFGR